MLLASTVTMPEISEWLKLISPRYVVPIAAATGFLVFAPDTAIAKVGLTTLKQTYEAWIGGLFLFSSVLLASQFVFGVSDWIRGSSGRRAWQRKAIQRLHQLSLDEQYVLQPYLVERVVTRNLDFTNGVVATLEHEGIITKAAAIGHIIDGWPYRINDWAFNYLMEAPDGLKAEGSEEASP